MIKIKNQIIYYTFVATYWVGIVVMWYYVIDGLGKAL